MNPSKKPKQLAQDDGKSKRSEADTVSRLFIDPASISSGWALYRGSTLVDHGTVLADKRLGVFARLQSIATHYKELSKRLSYEEFHIEKMPRRVHYYTIWSCGVIGTSLKHSLCDGKDDIPVRSWQKFVDWDTIRDDWEGQYVSQDEWAAICMGRYYLGVLNENPAD